MFPIKQSKSARKSVSLGGPDSCAETFPSANYDWLRLASAKQESSPDVIPLSSVSLAIRNTNYEGEAIFILKVAEASTFGLMVASCTSLKHLMSQIKVTGKLFVTIQYDLHVLL